MTKIENNAYFSIRNPIFILDLSKNVIFTIFRFSGAVVFLGPGKPPPPQRAVQCERCRFSLILVFWADDVFRFFYLCKICLKHFSKKEKATIHDEN